MLPPRGPTAVGRDARAAPHGLPRTHYSVGRRRAADEAFDLALLAVEGVLGLGAGDDGRSCGGNSITSGLQKPWRGGGAWAQAQELAHYFSHTADIS